MMKKTIGQKFSKLCLLIPSSIALSGIAVLVYQICFLSTRGQWKPFSSRLALDIILPPKFFQWLQNTGPWSILKKIISPFFNFPLSLFLMIFGMMVLLLAFKIFDTSSKPEKNNQDNTNPALENQHCPGLLRILSSQNGYKSNVTINISQHIPYITTATRK